MYALRKSRQARLRDAACDNAPCPSTFSPVPVMEQRLFLPRRTHWSDRLAVAAAAVVAHADVARIEVEEPRVVRAAGVERTRPVAAVAACIDEAAIVTAAGSGKEECVAVGGGEQPTIHAVLLRPGDGCVVDQLLHLCLGGHAPAVAPVGRGSIVLGQEGGQVIGEALVAVAGIGAVLGQRSVAAVAVLVGAPVVGVLRCGLAPGEVVAVVLGAVGTHVAGGPLGAARQAQINVGVAE